MSASHRGNSQEGDAEDRQNDSRDREDDEDVELLGWRTRLIERAGQNQQKIIRTIRLSETPTVSPSMNVATSSLNSSRPQIQMGASDMQSFNPSMPEISINSTNDLVRCVLRHEGCQADLFCSCTIFGIPFFYKMCLILHKTNIL